MPKSVFSGSHRHLVDVLTAARKRSGLTQAEVAAKVGKDQSYISIIEGGQRRVDVLEFFALAKAMHTDPLALFSALVERLPDDLKV